jgi:hypothetical protein
MEMKNALWIGFVWLVGGMTPAFGETGGATPTAPPDTVTRLLDAPLLFVKRHSYTGIHIYDTFYKWPPGGGGIYVLENPAAPRDQWKIRAVIDPNTPETLGFGVYTHPELSYDATKLLFCFKGEPSGSTAIFEIGIDGKGLRRLTDPSVTCDRYHGGSSGQHDIAPAYLPDGRIVFLSTRPSGLVPCANSGVSILHVMNADGSDIHPISVNHVNEFDPSVMPDGRILFGRWEYVDKNALTIQSLWTVNPDGTQETALFANNMVFPEAILDARVIPGTHLVVGTLAKHNSTPRGSIGIVDPLRGKNEPRAIHNLEHPEDPTYDRGDSCEPWPVTEDLFLLSGRPAGSQRNVLELLDRSGHRFVLMSDPDICLHSPMLVKPQPRPPVCIDSVDRTAATGKFFLQDVYQGMPGVKRGEVKWLRVLEETSRVSPTLMGGSPYNQVFLVSAALAFNVKNFLGVVPVAEDGSAYFEVPVGRGVFFQALDAEGRTIHSMRSFVQAAPGTTRSCIGCHEHKYSSASNSGPRQILSATPSQLQPESWGSGYVDYPSMVQPILDKHCVSCHGGEKGIAAGMDLSGGWTEHFNISYENLANRLETQLTAYWIAGIDCMNGTALWSSQLFPPRSHGSGAAPLAELLVRGHNGYIPDLTRRERDLIMAWIDTNGLYHGNWDETEAGCAIRDWKNIQAALTSEMQVSGCLKCHGDGQKISYFEDDWINLKQPEMSRILRAPLPKDSDGFGLGLCRDRKVDASRQRIHMLWNGYAHAVLPPEQFPKRTFVPYDPSGQPVSSLASPQDPHYLAMLAILRDAREQVLASPRVDMPGAKVIPGACRMFAPPLLPNDAPPPSLSPLPEGGVRVTWERSARIIGLNCELHRSQQADFTPGDSTLLVRTPLSEFSDWTAPAGPAHYALVLISGDRRSKPAYATLDVPAPLPPQPPKALRAVPAPSAVRLRWQSPDQRIAGYNVYRSPANATNWQRLTTAPVSAAAFVDGAVQDGTAYRYSVRTVSLRGDESDASNIAEATARIVRGPVFVLSGEGEPAATLDGGEVLQGKRQGNATLAKDTLNLPGDSYVTFPHREMFDLSQPLTVECWIRFDQPGRMPVVVSCGVWNQTGWFLQRLGGVWRWHVGGVDCDGGHPGENRWIHLAAVYDGSSTRLFEDGLLVGEKKSPMTTAVWPGELHVGTYSGSPSPDYHVTGQLAGLKLYQRALDSREIAEAAKNKPQ